MNKHPIGIFDSGIGGLSVVNEIKKVLPNESIIYLADKKNFPYGEKTPRQIINAAEKNTKWLLTKNVKLIVVACNTATVNAISHLREKFKNIDFVGMEPAVKPAAIKSKKGIIILSSPKAAASSQLNILIKKFTKGIKVINLSSLELVKAVESRKGYKEIQKILKNTISKKQLNEADVLVLGCTHFPLIKDKIQKFVGKSITIIDSGEAVAKRVEFLLKERKMLNTKGVSNYNFFTTGKVNRVRGLSFREINI